MNDFQPVNVSASAELGRKLAQLQAQVKALKRSHDYVTLTAELAGIADAISIITPCIIENFGEDRMAILDQLASLQSTVTTLQSTIQSQSGAITSLSNQVNAISVATAEVGWNTDIILPDKAQWARSGIPSWQTEQNEYTQIGGSENRVNRFVLPGASYRNAISHNTRRITLYFTIKSTTFPTNMRIGIAGDLTYAQASSFSMSYYQWLHTVTSSNIYFSSPGGSVIGVNLPSSAYAAFKSSGKYVYVNWNNQAQFLCSYDYSLAKYIVTFPHFSDDYPSWMMFKYSYTLS